MKAKATILEISEPVSGGLNHGIHALVEPDTKNPFAVGKLIFFRAKPEVAKTLKKDQVIDLETTDFDFIRVTTNDGENERTYVKGEFKL